MSKRWSLAALGVLLLLALIWALLPAEALNVAPQVDPSNGVTKQRAPPVPSPVAPVAKKSAPVPESIGADAEVWQAVASELGQLFVSCFVGDQYADSTEVKRGWFKLRTEQRQGGRPIVNEMDVVGRVEWNAPEGAVSTSCWVEERWAELHLRAFEEEGVPAPGVGVLGCGVSAETDAAGEATTQILARTTPCTLEFFRMADDQTWSTKFVRLGPIREHEVRQVTARLKDYEGEQRFFRSRDEGVTGESWLPEVMDDEAIAQQRVDQSQQRLDRYAAELMALEGLRGTLSSEANAVVEKAIEVLRESSGSIEERLQGERADLEALAPPQEP